MARGFWQSQLYVDAAYIQEDLEQLGINPWFGPGELLRTLNNLTNIDGKALAVRREIFYDAVDDLASTADEHRAYLNKLGLLTDTQVRLGTVTGGQG